MLQRKNKPAVMNALRDARLARNLTETQLATMADCEPATIVAIEDGEYTPSISLSLRLAWALGYPVEQLFWLPPPSPKRQGWPGRGDERSQDIFSESHLLGFGVSLYVLGSYIFVQPIFDLPTVTQPQDSIGHLFILILFATQFYALERRAKKPFDRFWFVRRAFYGAYTLFLLAVLGGDIGLTTPQIIVVLVGITAILIWALVLREFVRHRRPVQYHESYGDG